jgi:transposase
MMTSSRLPNVILIVADHHPDCRATVQYEARHLVENFFCWIKRFRAIATRYDKTARNFLAAVHLVAVLCWLN